MKPRPAHHYHICLSESPAKRVFSFVFRRIDLLRTAALYSTAPEPARAEETVGHLNMNVDCVNAGLYIAHIEFELKLIVRCTRCLEAADCLIGDRARVELKTDGHAGAYTFVERRPFDCRDLFEEEVLLRLPLNPQHESCTLASVSAREVGNFVRIGAAGGERAEGSGAGGMWRPFANIRALIDS